MTQINRDVAFLREYVDFTSYGPDVIAESLYNELINAHKIRNFDRVAHLQLKLFAEMVLSLETAGAFLYAYSRWDRDGGIVHTLFSYWPKHVINFFNQLKSCDNPLLLLRFPDKEDLVHYHDDTELLDEAYTIEGLKNEVSDILRIYLSDEVRLVYNKLKHAALYIRHPDLLTANSGKVIMDKNIYVMLPQEGNGSEAYASFRVTGEASLQMAEKHFNNTIQITKKSRSLAWFVAFCLEKNLMKRNTNVTSS